MFLKTVIKYVVIAIVGAAVIFGGWFWFAMKFSYSTGERAGYIQKFSKRGWVFKTWEGELAMVNLPGSLSEKFDFSVVNDAVAEKLQKSLGSRIVIKYEQHRYIPLPIFAETEYFVIDVLPVEN